MFRVPSLAGQAVDAVLEMRGTKSMTEDFYTQVNTSPDQTTQLQNLELGNILKINRDNVIFIKDVYDLDEEIDGSKLITQFLSIWDTLNETIQMKQIRRIGIAVEHHLDIRHSNQALINHLTKFTAPAHSAKFHMRFEERKPTKEALAKDVAKSDYINIIRDYYDSELDVDHPEKGLINLNLDVQRYYAPNSRSLNESDVGKLYTTFEKERATFLENLTTLGLVNSG